MRFVVGSNATLLAEFVTPEGVLVDPVGLVVDIVDTGGIVRVNDAIPIRVSQGFYKYVYAIPAGSVLGVWRVDWVGTVSGTAITGSEKFDVVSSTVNVVTGDLDALSNRLRRRLAEVGDLPGNTDTLFTDDEIRNLLVGAGNDIEKATLEGWLIKEAHYAAMIDISEHGSDRKLSQLWEHAKKMVDRYSGADGSVSPPNVGRLVGRAMSLRDDEEELLTPFSGYSDHIRVYAGKRFMVPAVL